MLTVLYCITYFPVKLINWKILPPDVYGVFHDSHICLTLGRRVDGQLSRWNDKAFAQRQPHSFSKSVRKPETKKIDVR